jgi:methyl-accepting chemotaxis protein PixJ
MTGTYQPSQSNRSATNGGTNSISLPLAPNISEFIEAFTTLKSELARSGSLEKSGVKEKVLQVEKFGLLVEKYTIGVQEQLDGGNRDGGALQLQQLRQQTNTIAVELRQASTQSDLFDRAVREIRNVLGGDRVLIYQFNESDRESGTVIAESIRRGWTPSVGEILPATYFGRDRAQDYATEEIVARSNTTSVDLTPYQQQLLERFQVQAFAATPIVLEGRVWGLLAIHATAQPRQWSDLELNLLQQVARELTLTLQSLQGRDRDRQDLQHKQKLARVIDKVRRAIGIDAIFRSATQEIRNFLGVDRVGIYRFYDNWSGEFVAESVGTGWVPLVGPDIKTVWEDTHLQDTQGGRYRYHETFAVDDIYKVGHSPCHIDILEQFQVRAYAIVPIFVGDKLWGLIGVYQNSGPRQWQELEINDLSQIAAQFEFSLQQSQYLDDLRDKTEQLSRAADRERLIGQIIDRIRQSLDLDTIFRTTVREVRRQLSADRVGVFQFYPGAGYDDGEFIAEDVQSGFSSAVAAKVHDHCFGDEYAAEYTKGRIQAVADIYDANFSNCHIDILSQFEVRANLIVPLLKGSELWGLLCIHQCSEPREWQEDEIEFTKRIAAQFTVALQQAQNLEQIQAKSDRIAQAADRDRALTQIIDRIRQSLDLPTIFNSTAREVRRLIEADRVGVFQFYPNTGYDDGEFVAEDVKAGFSSAIAAKVHDHCFGNQYAAHYAEGRIQAVADIYDANLSDCHIDILSQFQVRANLIVPLLKGSELWGLLCIHQCSESRQWQEDEIDFIKKIAAQFTVALQQAEYLQQLQAKSEQLAEAAQREKAAKEQLQQRALQLLTAVRPALEGNLTVRAPITEDEMGTIADAYNNTLQSLRKIVVQVQTAAAKVVETANNSDTSIVALSEQAQTQFGEIRNALNRIQEMVDVTQTTATNARQAGSALQRANQTLEAGDSAMNRTVDGILSVRKTVSDTTKRLEKLNQSSQAISKVVNLIGNFATQTNLLALNAAIEATRAGEYGRGFAVVAEEVRSLARQSADATSEIEKLVQEIQAETEEVTEAMETASRGVAQGTELVDETRQNLNDIVAVTAEINRLVEGITDATQLQNEQAESVTQLMSQVAAIANRTSEDSSEISASFKQVLETARDLQASAGRFTVS